MGSTCPARRSAGAKSRIVPRAIPTWRDLAIVQPGLAHGQRFGADVRWVHVRNLQGKVCFVGGVCDEFVPTSSRKCVNRDGADLPNKRPFSNSLRTRGRV